MSLNCVLTEIIKLTYGKTCLHVIDEKQAPLRCPWVGAKGSGFGFHSGTDGWRQVIILIITLPFNYNYNFNHCNSFNYNHKENNNPFFSRQCLFAPSSFFRSFFCFASIGVGQ